MSWRSAGFLCCVGLALGSLSCSRLESRQAGELKFQDAKSVDAIPAEYGRLVNVTSDSSHGGWSQLWFEMPDRIMVVYVDYQTGKVGPKVLAIPRR
jgi:hypothetical protein